MTPIVPGGFFARRWRGEISWPTLFWRDMLGVGTVLNALASFGALMLLALGAPATIAVAAHFAPVPYNAFLFVALCKLAKRPAPVVALAAAWLVVMMVV